MRLGDHEVCNTFVKNKNYNILLLHISTYDKILGETNFQTWELPRSGQKQKTERKRKERERLNDGNNNGRLCIANTTSAGSFKAAWANNLVKLS